MTDIEEYEEDVQARIWEAIEELFFVFDLSGTSVLNKEELENGFKNFLPDKNVQSSKKSIPTENMKPLMNVFGKIIDLVDTIDKNKNKIKELAEMFTDGDLHFENGSGSKDYYNLESPKDSEGLSELHGKI